MIPLPIPTFVLNKVIKSVQQNAEWKNIPLVRRGFDRLTYRWLQPHPTVAWKPETIAGMQAAWLLPNTAIHSKKVLLYLHGGGYAVGSPSTHRNMIARLVKDSKVNALLIDYRLAPENPYPAALEDAVAAYKWLLENGYTAANIAIGGDSAGGGLALATLLYLRDQQLPLPACAVLFSPWSDLSISHAAHIFNREKEVMLVPDALTYWAKLYYGNENPENPYISPTFGDFHGLPPLLIEVGGNEILLDDSLVVAQKAKQQGVEVTATVYPNNFHVFQGFWMVSATARKSLRKTIAFLEEKLKG